jgi:hypothetical protein
MVIRIGARDAPDELQVVGFRNSGRDGAAGPPGDPGDADANGHRSIF